MHRLNLLLAPLDIPLSFEVLQLIIQDFLFQMYLSFSCYDVLKETLPLSFITYMSLKVIASNWWASSLYVNPK